METRDQRPETRDQRPETRDQRPDEIIVVNKSDLYDQNFLVSDFWSLVSGLWSLVSAKTGFGFDKLLEKIREKIHEKLDGLESEIIVNERTRTHLITAKTELESALNTNNNFDIFANHIHNAADAIGQILGLIGTNEIMDATFNQLCLGK